MWHVAPVGIQQRKRPRASPKRFQHFHETALSQRLLNNKPVRLKQPGPVFGQGHATQHIIGTAVPRRPYILLGFAVHLEQPGNTPAITRQFVLDALMPGQILQGLRRTDSLEVSRGCHHHQFSLFQRARDQRRVRLGTHANGQVITFGDEVDIAIADVDVDADLRVQRTKFGQQRQQTVVGVGGRDTDAQQPGRDRLRAHDCLLRLDQLRQRLAALLEKSCRSR